MMPPLPIPLPDAVLDKILDKVAPIFDEDVFPTLADRFRSVARVDHEIIRHLFSTLSIKDPIHRPPTGVDEFCYYEGLLMKPWFVRRIGRILDGYDQVCGARVAAVILSEQSMLYWTHMIIEGAFVHHTSTVLEKCKWSILDWYGPDHKPLQPDVPVQPISLEGESLRDVWCTNPDIERMYDDDSNSHSDDKSNLPSVAKVIQGSPSADSSPSVTGCNAPVASGTVPVWKAIALHPAALERARTHSLDFPHDDGVSATHMSFSPRRALLLAAFKAEFVHHCLTLEDERERGKSLRGLFVMKKNMVCHGIILLKFRSNQPARPGLLCYGAVERKGISSWPDGYITNYARMPYANTPLSFHSSHWGGEDFPDMVHRRDLAFLNATAHIVPPPGQCRLLWETILREPDDVASLNLELTNMYVVSFRRVRSSDIRIPLPSQQLAAQQIAAQQLAAQQLTDQQTPDQQLAYQHPVFHQPIFHHPIFHQPIYHQPVFHQPIYPPYVNPQPEHHTALNLQLLYNQFRFHQSPNLQPVYHPPTNQQPGYHQPVYHTPVYHQPLQPQPSTGQPLGRGGHGELNQNLYLRLN